MTPTRKTGIVLLALALLGTLVEAQGLAAAEELTAHRPTPLLHVTDLYHPHNDPDDHWDVATVYALAKMERVRLLGVLIDYPLKTKPDAFGGPAVQAVAQLNHIAGFAVPVAVGASVSYSDVVSGAAQLADWDRRGVDFILETLRSAPEPVAISVVGSCRDVALAGREHPEVFREKCRGIYLNAGTGTFDPAKGANQEWNVMLDPPAYRSIFEIPCPVYWLPCFDEMKWPKDKGPAVSPHGSYWRFRQGEVLRHLSPMTQNFFLYALTRNTSPRWLSYLHAPVDESALSVYGGAQRNMWCTAGFLHLAGLTVSKDGTVKDITACPASEALYAFPSITVKLCEQGVARWAPAPESSGRFIIEIHDTEAYAGHLTTALRTLLEQL